MIVRAVAMQQSKIDLSRAARVVYAAPPLLSAKLEQGELDAVLHSDFVKPFLAGDPRVARLFPDNKKEEMVYYRKTGIFPIMHVVGLRQTLAGSKMNHEVVVYPDAGRDFFDDSRASFNADAAEDAWKRALVFLDQHLEVPPRRPASPM